MPQFTIHVINAEFESHDRAAEYADADLALAAGVRGAAEIVLDEIHSGRTSAAAQVNVEDADGARLLRAVVSLSVAPLMP